MARILLRLGGGSQGGYLGRALSEHRRDEPAPTWLEQGSGRNMP